MSISIIFPPTSGKTRRAGAAWRWASSVAILLGMASPVRGAETAPAPGTVPDIPAIRVDTPPVIDGNLDDPCWQKAAQVTDFWASYYRRPPREKTTAFICYDASCLYVAFYCFDSQPEKIRAFQRKRDGALREDDRVEVEIDTFHSHRRDTDFTVNARGTQCDTLGSGKVGWKGDWQVATRIVKDGWIAEYAIPFAILDYPPGATCFGLNFNRYCQRLSEYTTYARPAIDVDEDRVEDYGHLVGLQLPPRKANHRPMIMLHELTSVASGSPGGSLTAGLDAKYYPTTNLASLLTLNPDFSTVEQDVAGIDFTYTERYLSDNRPFFTEGSAYFGDAYLYTRRIPQIDSGVKTYGRVGAYNLGAFAATHFGRRTDAALQIGRDFGNPFTGIVSLVGKSENGHENLVGRLHGTWRPGAWTFDVNSARTSTTGPGNDGARLTLSGSYGSEHWGGSAGYENTAADFNPEDGYVSYRDIRGGHADIHYDARSAAKGVQLWHVHLEGDDYRQHSGALIETTADIHTAITLRNGDQYRIQFSMGRHPDPDNAAILHTDRTVMLSGTWFPRDPYRSSGLSITAGRVRGSPYLLAGPYFGAHLTDALSFRLSTQFRAMNDDAGVRRQVWQNIGTLNYDISDERTLGARLIEREQGLNLSVSYRQAMRKGIDAYVIYGDPNADRTQTRLYAKVVFLL